MKKTLTIFLFLFVSSICFGQTNSTNFNCKDCVDNNHDLFTELNAGKVIVLVWVMPCGACISPSRTAYDAVQSYASSNPGRVVFYLVDDLANTSCNTMIAWGNANAMSGAVKFSNAAINPTDYGEVGMPKIIVLGGVNHTVFYNEDNGNNLAGIVPAIDLALAATSISENADTSLLLNVLINSEGNNTTIVYELKKEDAVKIEIIDITGKNIKTFNYTIQATGKHTILIDSGNFNNGLYFLRVSSGEASKIIKFVISK